jgi:hypothetical protein
MATVAGGQPCPDEFPPARTALLPVGWTAAVDQVPTALDAP